MKVYIINDHHNQIIDSIHYFMVTTFLDSLCRYVLLILKSYPFRNFSLWSAANYTTLHARPPALITLNSSTFSHFHTHCTHFSTPIFWPPPFNSLLPGDRMLYFQQVNGWGKYNEYQFILKLEARMHPFTTGKRFSIDITSFLDMQVYLL